ncbi:MAG: methionine--tRNA ligase [Pelagibacteraceae bacterium]|nr:methionine--tRNA ligase [Pelagibacteraceae bacterium]|tara:strand:+ start:13871 stop:15412 length:1542 start_codon:yes stop_codon:yes gene_type:complete
MSKNFYITTPIYYPSGKPHMGHAYSSIVADIFARFKKLEGYNVLFLTGTDEHGLKIQREAEKKQKSPKEFCDELSQKFRNLSKTLNLSNNDFIRTTEKRHFNSVEEIWNRLVKSGDIYLGKYSGWYSVSDEAYYDEDEIETIDGKKISKVSGSKVDWVEEESFFFKLSSWTEKLLNHYNENKNFILPTSRKNEVINFVKKGLKDLSVSRTSFSWGIPVPNNKKHIIYVWLDALTNYLSAINFPNINDKKYKDFWPANIHIIGKDILRFHAVYWPAFLLAAKLPLPKRIFSHGWILSDEKKMSKSLGNILDPIEIIKNYGVDQLRYYLVKEVSLGNDGSVSMMNLRNCINNDLANNYGNLCQRVFSFIKKNCSNKIPKNNTLLKEDIELLNKLKNNLPNLIEMMDNQKLNEFIKEVVGFSFDANKYFNDSEPWALKKNDPDRMKTILFVVCEQIKNISILLNPIIPIATGKVFNTMNIDEKDVSIEHINNQESFNHNNELKDMNILFQKVENDN